LQRSAKKFSDDDLVRIWRGITILREFESMLNQIKTQGVYNGILDYTKIVESVRKTGRVLLTSDACVRNSFLNDVAQNITAMCFDDLDAPPVVVGARNWTTPPFEFDSYFFPQKEWMLDAIHQQIIPLPGYVPAGGCTESEQIRRAKKGV